MRTAEYKVVWTQMDGDLARVFNYAGQWGSVPYFIDPGMPPEEARALDNLQLLKGLVFCWDQAPPHGAAGIPGDWRVKMITRLSAILGGYSLPQGVGVVCSRLLAGVGLDEGMRAAVNGLEICAGDHEYTRMFIGTASVYMGGLGPAAAARTARAIVRAAETLDPESVAPAELEIALAAETAALAGLDDKEGLSKFYKKRLARFEFTVPELAELAADLVVRPGLPLAEAFDKLSQLVIKAHRGSRSELEPAPAPYTPPRRGRRGKSGR